MPLPLTANTAKVTLQGRVDGQETINTLWFEKAGGAITPPDIQSLAVQVAAWYETVLAPLLCDAWQAEVITAQDQSVGLGALTHMSMGRTPGGVGSEPAPNNVAACVSFRTLSAGRGFRGRNFVPAIPNAEITINTLSSGFIASIINAYNGILAGGSYDPSPFVWVVVSHFLNGVPRGAGLATIVVNPVFTTPYVRSMRTREVGKGK